MASKKRVRPVLKKRLKTTSSSSSSSAEDRISSIPDALILHILSFLPTVDAVSTSFLSNRWKRMWYLVPNLSFSITASRYKSSQDQEKLCNYVDSCLEHRKKAMFYNCNSVLTSFKLHMDCYERSKDHHLDKWLAFAVEKNVKELNLCLRVEKQEGVYFDLMILYSLPKTLAVNARYLTIFELNRVELNSDYSYSFPSLKTLSLTYVNFVSTSVVDMILLGSPFLEKLLINYCFFYTISSNLLQIRSSSLKFLEIRLVEIHWILKQIEAINLESLELNGVCFGSLNLSVGKAITNLSLSCDWRMKESSSLLEYFISNLPLLENLTLGNSGIGSLKHIKLSNQHLKSFNVNNPYDDEMTVMIEQAPQLASFCYTGNINFSISMESSNSLNGTFVILGQHENYDGDWFINMMNFLMNLNCSWNMVTLQVDTAEALIFPKNLKRMFGNLKIVSPFPLVNWDHLRVFTKCKPEKESELRDVLLWIFPSLKTLSIAKGLLKQ